MDISLTSIVAAVACYEGVQERQAVERVTAVIDLIVQTRVDAILAAEGVPNVDAVALSLLPTMAATATSFSAAGDAARRAYEHAEAFIAERDRRAKS